MDISPESRKPGIARRTLGICLLLIVVVLWTTSNFLASTIFADNTYSKPFFVTYVNTTFFVLPLFTIILSRLWRLWRTRQLSQIDSLQTLLNYLDSPEPKAQDGLSAERAVLDALENNEDGIDETSGLTRRDSDATIAIKEPERLGLKGTAKLSFQFCLLWFSANYFALASLQYTTVGSATILTSTSGVWTLIFGALLRVERFTIRKLLGVIASLAGIILISRLDVSKSDAGADTPTGTFPDKPPGEFALGDAMAAISAIVYGVYTIVMKRQVGDESRVNMQLFFGLVGFFNLVLLWPGFVVLHFLGVEELALPGSSRVWGIMLVNSLTSLISDICWAYAMLLTTPLVVTVGLSLTIPLSLVGQIVLQAQYASPLYWVGATVVFGSFLVVNHESRETTITTAPEVYDSLPVDETGVSG